MAALAVPDSLHGQLMCNKLFSREPQLGWMVALLYLTQRSTGRGVMEKSDGFSERNVIRRHIVE